MIAPTQSNKLHAQQITARGYWALDSSKERMLLISATLPVI